MLEGMDYQEYTTRAVMGLAQQLRGEIEVVKRELRERGPHAQTPDAVRALLHAALGLLTSAYYTLEQTPLGPDDDGTADAEDH
jgi:hypothetical protein